MEFEHEESEGGGMSRMQELLSSYYGMQGEDESPQDVTNIDSSCFQPEMYVESLLRSMSLNELLEKDNKLIHEIKTLDSDMQMLVYENYNKFISATDTIRQMKRNVESMETDMTDVVRRMDVIMSSSGEINGRLAERRAKVEKLVGVGRLLKRLEFLFELPQLLHSAIQDEKYAKATKYYTTATKILDRYSHIASFGTIRTEAEATMADLCDVLRVKCDSDSPVDPFEYTRLLLELGEPASERRQVFLKWHEINCKSIDEGFLAAYIRIKEQYESLFTAQDDLDAFEAFTRCIFDLYFIKCRKVFQATTNLDDFIALIQRFKTEMDVVSILAAETSEIIEKGIRSYLTIRFKQIESQCASILANDSNTSMKDILGPVLAEFEPLNAVITETSSHISLQFEYQRCLTRLCTTFESCEAQHGRNMLLLSLLCKDIDESETSAQILHAYMQFYGRHVSSIIRKGVMEIQDAKPRDISPFIETYLHEMGRIATEVADVLGEPLRLNDLGRDFRTIQRNSTTAVGLDIERMFAKRLQIFNSCVELTVQSILTHVFEIGLKAFFEYVRLGSFTRHGYHQVQIDTHFIKLIIPQLIKDTTSLDNLLAEVIASCADRSIGATESIESSVLTAITSTKKAKFQLVK